MVPFHEPQQTRSRETLERIVEAAEDLLTDRRFDEVTVDDIVARADASKGSFYSRFADKESLLRYLNDVHFEKVLADWGRFLEPSRWDGVPLRDVVRGLVRRVVRLYRTERHLWRAFSFHARLTSDTEVTAKARRLNRYVTNRIVDLLLERGDAIGHRDPRAAIRFGMVTIAAVAREMVLFDDGPVSLRLGDARLVDELTEQFLGYIQNTSSAPPRHKKGQK